MKRLFSATVMASVGFFVSQSVVAQPPRPASPPADIEQLAGEKNDRPEPGERGEKHAHGPRGPRDPAKVMERLDANQDGQLSKDEMPERMQRHFEKIDTDTSGAVTAEELATAFARHQSKRRGGKRGKGQRGAKGDRQSGPDGRRQPDPAKMIERMDTDGDGKISKTEAPERMLKKFDKLDANANGFVELAEVKAAIARRAVKRARKETGPHRQGGSNTKPVMPKTPPADDAP